MELKEAIKIKDAEGEAYILEIEVRLTLALDCAFSLIKETYNLYHNLLTWISIILWRTDNWSSI
jgi:hypothetical protein